MNTQNSSLLPHVTFGIMFALSIRPQYGYQLIQQIAQDSGGKVHLGPGALYGAIKQLRTDNLIEEIPFADEAGRRRYYRLTRKGWNALEADLDYYRSIAQLVAGRSVFRG